MKKIIIVGSCARAKHASLLGLANYSASASGNSKTGAEAVSQFRQKAPVN